MRDVKIKTNELFINAKCIPETPVENVVIENMDVESSRFAVIRDVKNFIIRNSVVRCKDMNMEVIDAQGIKFENVEFINPE